MRRQICKRVDLRAFSIVGTLCVVGLLLTVGGVCQAADGGDAPSQIPVRPEIRSGGVLEESYVYHRQSPGHMAGAARSVEPAGGWYGYGFPVSTFRWGWFGAAHYYPTVFWHDGYYGDCCRYGYRRGY
jgi:hypothetical protein